MRPSSKVSVHKYPNEHSTSQSSWTGGMVSYDTSASTNRRSSSRKESDSIPYEYQPHQSKVKKPTNPPLSSNYERSSSTTNLQGEAVKNRQSRTTRAPQHVVEESPRSTTSISSGYDNSCYEEEEEEQK